MRVDNRRGFTLIELMLVVGIIGVVAAVAIPNFVMYQARSRRSEAYTNLSALARSQKAFQAERNEYHDSGLPFPDAALYNGGMLGAASMPWDAASQAAFSDVGWSPEGKVFYSYGAYTDAGQGLSCGGCDLCFTAAAYGDVDGNGVVQPVLFVHPEDVGGVQTYCIEPVLNLGPPLDPNSGQLVFDEVAVRSNSDF
jgi:type IV pilus assembly protein PilA